MFPWKISRPGVGTLVPVGASQPLERRGTGPARPGPHFLGRNGEKNPRGKRFFPLDSLLWWGCVGEGCTSCGIPGLRPSLCHAGNGPPTGWAGWGRGQVPFGKRRRKTISFPTFSSRQRTTSPARPSRWAGHEALVLEAAGQAHTDPTTFPLVFFLLFLPKKWGPAREGSVPARSNGDGKIPHRSLPPTQRKNRGESRSSLPGLG